MNKYILGLLAGTCMIACEPVTNDKDVDGLETEWKKTAEDAKSLSEKLDKTLTEWEARYENDSSVVADENPNCQSIGEAYKDMKITVQSFIDGMDKESMEVDRLTTDLETDNWTEDDQNQLTSLKLAIDEKDAEIERWEYNLDSLQKACPTPTFPVIEK